MSGEVRLKPGRGTAFRRGYPLVRRSDIAFESGCEDGGIVTVTDGEGVFVGRGSYFGRSHVPVRIFLGEDEEVDTALFESRFAQCLDRRDRVVTEASGYRAVFAEADLLPGLVVDMYGQHAVVQVRTLAMERLRGVWLPALVETFGALSVYERSDFSGRASEGLEPFSGQLRGETPDTVPIEECGVVYECPVLTGLKTGHYFDQRDSRKALKLAVRPGDRVLDLFCSTGGFSLVAAVAGAEVLGVDMDEASIAAARRNASLNGLTGDFVTANAFEFLEEGGATYDWIVLDPPAIAKHKGQKSSLRQAIYKLVRLALPRLAPRGRVLVCTCSYQLTLEEMLETVREAAGDGGHRLALTGVTTQGEDHPVPLHYPEAWYLKCLWLQLLS